jgi:hypothetical protein
MHRNPSGLPSAEGLDGDVHSETVAWKVPCELMGDSHGDLIPILLIKDLYRLSWSTTSETTILPVQVVSCHQNLTQFPTVQKWYQNCNGTFQEMEETFVTSLHLCCAFHQLSFKIATRNNGAVEWLWATACTFSSTRCQCNGTFT